MSGEYPVPAESIERSYEIKKSRFIARAFHAESREQVKVYVEQMREAYPDARHHCWAYQLGDPHSPRQAAMHDAGEPSGTAGRPILNVIQHKGIGDLLIVVARYFGGIKLGAGGLTRAYSSAAQQVMADLKVQAHVAMVQAELEGEFSSEQPLRHWIEGHGGSVEAVDYAGGITMACRLPQEAGDGLAAFCRGRGITCRIEP